MLSLDSVEKKVYSLEGQRQHSTFEVWGSVTCKGTFGLEVSVRAVHGQCKSGNWVSIRTECGQWTRRRFGWRVAGNDRGGLDFFVIARCFWF